MENHALTVPGAQVTEKNAWTRRVKGKLTDMMGVPKRRVGLMRKAAPALAALLLSVAHLPASASIITPIDTLPAPAAPTGSMSAYASYQWYDLAVGFVAPSAGHIRHIATSLFAHPSMGPFHVGVASNALIGNPANPSYYDAPASSLAEFSVCADAAHPSMPWVNACDNGGSPVDFHLLEDQALSFAANIFLPSAGTYWVYTRFLADDVFASWMTNLTTTTSLVAMRTGIDPFDPAHSTFHLAGGPTFAPGLRIDFEPGQVPEPHAMSMLLAGLAGLALHRRRKNTQ